MSASRAEELRALMDVHNLTARDVADMLKRQPQTVRIWRCKHPAREIPQDALDVLRFKVRELRQ